MKRLVQLLILSVLLAVPSRAAVYMKSQVHGSAPADRRGEEMQMSFEGWFDGDRAVIQVLESNQAMFDRGTIFVDGSIMTLYDPEENTCAPWDLQATMRLAGQVMEAMSGLIKIDFGEPQIEVLERRGGLSLLGRPVDYLKYRSDWTMSINAPLMKKQTYDNSTVQEIWYDEDLLDSLPAFGMFMDRDSFTTGYEEMDNAIAAGMPPVEGAVLKSVATSTVTNQKGKEETTTTTSEVTELDLAAADPPGGYAPPADCRAVPAPTAIAGAGEEGDQEEASEESGNPLSKLKVGNPFKRKKKDDG